MGRIECKRKGCGFTGLVRSVEDDTDKVIVWTWGDGFGRVDIDQTVVEYNQQDHKDLCPQHRRK